MASSRISRWWIPNIYEHCLGATIRVVICVLQINPLNTTAQSSFPIKLRTLALWPIQSDESRDTRNHMQKGNHKRNTQIQDQLQKLSNGYVQHSAFISSNRAIEQSSNRAIEQSSNRAIEQSSNRAIEQSSNRAEGQKGRRAKGQRGRRAEEQKSKRATRPLAHAKWIYITDSLYPPLVCSLDKYNINRRNLLSTSDVLYYLYAQTTLPWLFKSITL